MSSQIDIRLSEADLQNPDAVVGIINSWAQTDQHNRTERVKAWSEAINFFAGNQWIRYNERSHRFEPIPVTDSNRIIDRPVSNHIYRWVMANVSRFTNRPTVIVDPNSEEQIDKTSAKLCEIIKDYLWEENDKDAQYLEASLWGTICGTVFRKGFKKYTNRVLETSGGEKIPIRCADSDIVSPFQVVFDGLPQRWSQVGTIMHMQVRRIDDIKRQFEINQPGYFPDNAQELKEEELISTSLQYSEGLKSIVDGSGSYYPAAGGAQQELKESAIYKEAYVQPSQKHPRGIMICSAADKLLYMGDSPYFYLDGKIWHPFTSWTWGTMPGSIWGIGLVSLLLKLQKRINQIDALLAYNRKTMAVPGWTTPSGSNIPEGTFIGIPGLVKQYDETPSGARPEPHPGQALPAQVQDERESCVQDGDRIALAGDIRSGDNPRGVNTLGQLQILTEQAELSQAKTVESWEKFIERSETLDLLNFKDCYQGGDEKLLQSFKKYSKDITDSDWKSFTGNEIRDNATIRVEKGSTIAKSRILRQQTLLKLASLGFFPELFTDPYQYKKFLEQFGMADMYTDANIDVKFAEKSIEMMLANEYPPVLPEVHNPDIQLPIIMRYMKDPKYLELDPKIQVLFDKRRKELVAALVAAGPVAPPPEVGGQDDGGMNQPNKGQAGADSKTDFLGEKGLF